MDDSSLARLQAYAKLVHLRRGRQIEEPTTNGQVNLEVSASKNGAEESCSMTNHVPGGIDQDGLRSEFLDRFSECLSGRKGGRHVVATLMISWPDRVKILVAKNSGLTKADCDLLNKIEAPLRQMAATPGHPTYMALMGAEFGLFLQDESSGLWATLLEHQKPRLVEYISDLRKTLKKHLPGFLVPENPESSEVADAETLASSMLSLGELLLDRKYSELEKHSNLVNKAYVIHRHYSREDFDALTPKGHEVRRNIGLLGRLRAEFNALARSACQLPGFDNLACVPVVHKFKGKRKVKEWTLSQVFQSLGRPLDDNQVETIMGASSSKGRWTRDTLLSRFSGLKSPTWEVHAEIQLIFHLLQNDEEATGGRVTPYVGCNKYSCLLCSNFLQAYESFGTRGCHGKLYDVWSIPSCDTLEPAQKRTVARAINNTTLVLKRELLAKRPSRPIREAKESTVGGPSIDIGLRLRDTTASAYAVTEYLKQQHAEALHSVERSALREAFDDTSGPAVEPAPEPREASVAKSSLVPHECTTCLGHTTRQCSYCDIAPFCSKACELRMGLSHLIRCRMRQVTAADYLYSDVLSDDIPTDPQVREKYWFDRCPDRNSESHLLGLFIGLVKYLGIHRETLHQWKERGNPFLVAKIIETFTTCLPEGSRGSYFSWFQRNKELFKLPDGSTEIPRPPSPHTMVRRMAETAKRFLSPEDQGVPPEHFQPYSKARCFRFYSMICGGRYPPPMNMLHDDWYGFGFVVCDDEHEESRLSGMYMHELFGSLYRREYNRSLGVAPRTFPNLRNDNLCNFDDFWRSWERGDLIPTLERYNPRFQRDDHHVGFPIHRLRKFLSYTATEKRPAIWHLRHFLALKDTAVVTATSDIASAAGTYGFREDMDKVTEGELREFYIELGRREEPWDIQREMEARNLLAFATGSLGTISPRVQSVLKRLG